MPMTDGYNTINQVATRLGMDRSGVFRRARNGDFGDVIEMGGSDDRPAMLLIPTAGVDAFLAQRDAS